MATNEKIQYLIVDTSAFIENISLQEIGVNIITEEDVVNEITNKRQLRRLVVLPYDLMVQSACPENIKFVTEFAKKTGDYPSLSATDIKVIALTYQLQKEKVGTKHLKEAPTIVKTITAKIGKNEAPLKPIVGFYLPKKKQKEVKMSPEMRELERKTQWMIVTGILLEKTYVNHVDTVNTIDLTEKFTKLNCEPAELEAEREEKSNRAIDNISALTKEMDEKTANEQIDDSEDEFDDNDWITPSNITKLRKQMNLDLIQNKSATVACLTTDFAMQNVLMQIGLNVASLNGTVIKQMRTFILRCYACFKTTSIMTKVFCPNCGNKTLKKVAISLDDQGIQHIHINARKPLSSKGKRFSLPMPKGGKHADNPILCEDQPVPQQRASKLARTKNNPLQEDYIAGYSPFIMRDVSSKSAMLGIRPGGAVKYWMRKNPNEPRRKKK